jgi:hypothetical protein
MRSKALVRKKKANAERKAPALDGAGANAA